MLAHGFMLVGTSRLIVSQTPKGLRVGDLSLYIWGNGGVQRGKTICKLHTEPARNPGLDLCPLILSPPVYHVSAV